jgi:hypothetical protein
MQPGTQLVVVASRQVVTQQCGEQHEGEIGNEFHGFCAEPIYRFTNPANQTKLHWNWRSAT